MPSKHSISINSIKPQIIKTGGQRIDVTARELPVLKGLSLSLLTLEPKAVREPHWHPNANELSYCTEGTGLMTIFSPGSGHDSFILERGTIAFVPMGYLHHIENTGNTPLRLALCFDHESPEDLNISAGVSVMPDTILAATFGLKPKFFDELKVDSKGTYISVLEKVTKPPLSDTTGRFKMQLEATNPQVNTKGGWVKMSNGFLFPALHGLAVYSLLLKQGGAREPHWHPNSAELNFLISGTARITLLSPNGQVETFDMKAGDLSYMPKGYLHHIENTGTADARFAVFFNHIAPSDIGVSGCLGAYSNDVLASLFGVPATYFNGLPKLQNDVFVVHGGG